MIAAPASETLRIETLPLIVKKGPLEGEITPSGELRQRAAGEVRTRAKMAQSQCGIRDRSLACEPLAEVDGSRAVDERLPGEQRHLVSRADRDDGGRLPRPSAARATSESTGPRIASSRGVLRWRSSAQSAQPKAVGARSSAGRTRRSTETAAALELVVAVDPGEPDQHVREHRVTGRNGVVVELLRPRDEALAVGRARERSRRARRRRRARSRAARAGSPRGASEALRSRRGARAGRARRSRSRRGSRHRSCGPRDSCAGAGRRRRRAGRAGTRRAFGRRRPSPAARAGARLLREPRARARSTRRSPCRHGAASAAALGARGAGRADPRRARRG